MAPNDLCLLALDGGGVRGLSALMILEQLMETVNPEAPPKPCDYFDMIGGTSTGGLIAIMLGRLRMSVDESISAYLSLSGRIFRKTRHRVTMKGKIQGRFDSDELAQAVKDVIKNKRLDENTLLKDEPDSGCKVFVCATSKETSETVCLTSYRSARGNRDLLNSVKMWEACRATSAASSFFDPIAIGRYKEEFVDGGTGANNPVREIWDQAQQVWGPEPLEGKLKCLVSIGTGIPSLKPFKDDIYHIGETLVAIATETEQTAESFRRERSQLYSTGRYYRFNVLQGLEDIGLEESTKTKEIAAATRRYITSDDASMQMKACASGIGRRQNFGQYRTIFSTEAVPKVKQFVDRPEEMAKLEQALLPRLEQQPRQKIHVLYGLGGIGKTQLAVEFTRLHHRSFSSIFWLDGRSENSVKRSIASYASRIPWGQIAESSREYAANRSADVDAVVKDVLRWLADPDNSAWLLIFDNVDRDYSSQCTDPDAYNVRHYLSGADHGSVLITTRLARLEQLGDAQCVGKAGRDQARAIFESWYKRKHDAIESERLLKLLDGLPLAIAQAGAYLQESRISLSTYLRFYKQQWNELMESTSVSDAPLQDYPDRSVGTTWIISYKAIHDKHKATANLLLLWSCIDNKDLWYGLFAAACHNSVIVKKMLQEHIGDIATSELKFSKAMQLLRNYSLIEELERAMGYATHPVVHQWAYHYQGKSSIVALSYIAVAVVGSAVPPKRARDCSIIQRRLLPHAQMCFAWIERNQKGRGGRGTNVSEFSPDGGQAILHAINCLGNLYRDQDKMVHAERMYERALRGREETLGPNHTSTLDTVNNLGVFYRGQGKMADAERMYERALRGREEVLGPNHTSTLQTVNNLSVLYRGQGKMADAERMYKRALRGREEVLGPNHTSTLDTVNNLGVLYRGQGKMADAERMYEKALRGREEVLGPNHTSTLETVNNLGVLYAAQGKITDAERMYERVLQGYEKTFDKESLRRYRPALNTLENIGDIYAQRQERVGAQAMYSRVLVGFQALGHCRDACESLTGKINALKNSSEERQDGAKSVTDLRMTMTANSQSMKKWKVAKRRRVRKLDS